ncbi:hypothetical protein [Syntrophothermus lipocalidus]|uniref:Uncharacterized protein n=1 Tax=Syntrophothermus lipocalidus (strain DSM 12680 / TGB-C1) TaxID=643648 RepID=D7CPC8_SYNLT|nr:hypothetical protein [Syntrophothermus lipocalidus]ADI02563.1 hypothetical protein Slip_1808 [Syntrophothermus lipocalidus DSM 12680]
MKRSWHAWLAVILSFLTVLANTPLVWAEVTYSSECIVASTSETNTTVGSLYVTADPEHRLGYYITQLKVSWEIQPGDSVRVRWWDGQATELQATVLDTGQVSVREQTVTVPSSACTAQIELTSGTATGNRYAWMKECTNNYGNTTVFVDPDIPTEPPPEEPPPEEPPPSGGGTDLSGVITELQNIGGQLRDIGGDVATIKSRMSDVISGISEVTDTLDTISSQLDSISSDMNSQFNAVKSRLDTISSDLAVVKNDLQTVKNYLTTPRTAQGLQVNPLPTVTFDSTVPDMSEPYQEPYEYDRPDPELPPAVFSPEPLPLAPDPEVMPHDEPVQMEQAVVPNEPLTRDQPLTRESSVMDQPLSREAPRQQDPVIMQDPLTREQPITRNTPYGRENPLTPAQPLTRQTPLTPDPPLTPGG